MLPSKLRLAIGRVPRDALVYHGPQESSNLGNFVLGKMLETDSNSKQPSEQGNPKCKARTPSHHAPNLHPRIGNLPYIYIYTYIYDRICVHTVEYIYIWMNKYMYLNMQIVPDSWVVWADSPG